MSTAWIVTEIYISVLPDSYAVWSSQVEVAALLALMPQVQCSRIPRTATALTQAQNRLLSIDGALMPASAVPITLRSAPRAGTSCCGSIAARALRLDHHWPVPFIVAVVAAGEIDSSNAGDLIGYLRRATESSRGLVLDLHRVKFIGTEALSVIEAMRLAGFSSSQTAVVTSPAVVRLLRLCPPGGSLRCSTIWLRRLWLCKALS